jgi:branched-chain amino acid transport system ATP-binding protein
LLEVEDLVVHYGRIPALQGISLKVSEGETVGVIGPNGAGKSTTLAAIMGLVAPSRGHIVFEGRSLVGQTPAQIVRGGLALVPEGRRIFGTLTVGENLQLGLTVRRDRVLANADLERVLDRFPALRTYHASSAAKLSGGEQQQLAIGRALLARPRLLLLDEPSLGLAPLMIDRVFETLEELRTEGVTILLVEQNAARTAEFADRTYVLRSGAVTMAGSRGQFQRTADLGDAYLGV